MANCFDLNEIRSWSIWLAMSSSDPPHLCNRTQKISIWTSICVRVLLAALSILMKSLPNSNLMSSGLRSMSIHVEFAKKKWWSSLIHMCHSYAEAMLIFSVGLQIRLVPTGNSKKFVVVYKPLTIAWDNSAQGGNLDWRPHAKADLETHKSDQING